MDLALIGLERPTDSLKSQSRLQKLVVFYHLCFIPHMYEKTLMYYGPQKIKES